MTAKPPSGARRRRRALTCLPVLLISTGCAPDVARLRMVERLPPPDLVLPCPDEPAPPDTEPVTVNDVLAHAVAVAEAGDICRVRHRKLSDWVQGATAPAR